MVLARAQCCFSLNAHSLDGWIPSDPDLLAEHAMFENGSRLTHSCGSSANTVYHCVDGRGQHRAVRAIAAGEILTTSYLAEHGGAVGMTSNAERRRYLREGYLFECSCPRCTAAEDRKRCFPCASCCAAGQAGALPRDPQTGLLPPPSDTDDGTVVDGVGRVAQVCRRATVSLGA